MVTTNAWAQTRLARAPAWMDRRDCRRSHIRLHDGIYTWVIRCSGCYRRTLEWHVTTGWLCWEAYRECVLGRWTYHCVSNVCNQAWIVYSALFLESCVTYCLICLSVCLPFPATESRSSIVNLKLTWRLRCYINSRAILRSKDKRSSQGHRVAVCLSVHVCHLRLQLKIYVVAVCY